MGINKKDGGDIDNQVLSWRNDMGIGYAQPTQ
jgi:hypothetical protein